MFINIVVGIDGSEASHRAVRIACDLAKQNEAALTLIHTPRPETVAFATGAIAGYHMVTTMPAPDEVEGAAQKILDEGRNIAVEMEASLAEAKVMHGDPGDTILDYAKQANADLIVTGRRGLGNLAGLVMGSTSQRIAHLATCAVLSVP